VQLVYTVAGGTANYRRNALQRALRDVHGVTQHIGTAPQQYEDASKRTFKAEAGVAGLGEVGGEYSQENAIVKLKGIAPKVSDLEDRLSAVCIQYWQGVLDTSLTPIPRMRASIREASPST
jgi:Acyl-CoA dehydrogenase, C-terminal domain